MLTGFLEPLGRKMSITLCCIPYLTGWITLYYYSNSLEIIYIVIGIFGFGSGLMEGTLVICIKLYFWEIMKNGNFPTPHRSMPCIHHRNVVSCLFSSHLQKKKTLQTVFPHITFFKWTTTASSLHCCRLQRMRFWNGYRIFIG